MTLGYLRGFNILDPFDNVERTIPETAALHRPPMMIITVGINGVALWDEAKFKEEYVHLIDEIKAASPDTEILLQSILPIAPSYAHWGEITNESITAANAWILAVAEECGLHYLDTFSVLVGDDGNIRPDLVQEDGLHANEDGLKLALEYIRTHAFLPAADAEDVPEP
jgi:lysophospholipase L1-like esterase